jgi:hypothetical protein
MAKKLDINKLIIQEKLKGKNSNDLMAEILSSTRNVGADISKIQEKSPTYEAGNAFIEASRNPANRNESNVLLGIGAGLRASQAKRDRDSTAEAENQLLKLYEIDAGLKAELGAREQKKAAMQNKVQSNYKSLLALNEAIRNDNVPAINSLMSQITNSANEVQDKDSKMEYKGFHDGQFFFSRAGENEQMGLPIPKWASSMSEYLTDEQKDNLDMLDVYSSRSMLSEYNAEYENEAITERELERDKKIFESTLSRQDKEYTNKAEELRGTITTLGTRKEGDDRIFAILKDKNGKGFGNDPFERVKRLIGEKLWNKTLTDQEVDLAKSKYLGSLKSIFGGQISDKDIELFLRTIPGTNNTPEALENYYNTTYKEYVNTLNNSIKEYNNLIENPQEISNLNYKEVSPSQDLALKKYKIIDKNTGQERIIDEREYARIQAINKRR